MDKKKKTKKKNGRMATPSDTGVMGAADQQLSHRLCAGEDLQRQAEKSLCTGAQLLFLPCRGGILPHWINAGCYRKLEFQVRLLCGGILNFCRGAGGSVRLRMALSFRANPGSAAQDTVSEETEKFPWRQTLA